MQKISFITPTHIGNGISYQNFCIQENSKMDFNDMINQLPEEQLLNPSFLNILKKNRNVEIAKQTFENLFRQYVDINKVRNEYQVNLLCEMKNIDVSENIKNLNSIMIPGSTLKGYILNVFLYDIIKNNEKIQKELFRKYKENSRNVYKDYINHALFSVSHFLTCSDIIFNGEIPIYRINRLNSKKETQMPVVIETLDQRHTASGEFIKNTYSKDVALNRKKGYVPSNDLNKIIYDELFKRIYDFKNTFTKANKEFIKEIIIMEKKFLSRNNSLIDITNINGIYNNIERIIDEDGIVIQIGRYTNYIIKSYGIGFDNESYEKLFEFVFKPSACRKQPITLYPKNIGGMWLVNNQVTSKFDSALGFVRIEL